MKRAKRPKPFKSSARDALERGDAAALASALALARSLNPFHRASGALLGRAIALGSVQCARVLLQAGAPPDQAVDGYTPLMRAARGGLEGAARLLLDAGADPSAAGRHQLTAAAFAAHRGDDGMLATLIAAGADLDWPGMHGATAAMGAARLGHAKCLRVLARAGANLDAVDAMGRTAALIAVDFDRPDALAALAESGAGLGIADKAGRTPKSAAMLSSPACHAILLAVEEAAQLSADTPPQAIHGKQRASL